MKSKNLKHHVTGFYQDLSMDASRLDAIASLTHDSPDNTAEISHTTIDASHAKLLTQNSVSLWAAACFAMVFVSLVFVGQRINYFSDFDMPQLIASEIALNHNKQLAIEFDSQSYPALNQLMSKLDFDLLPSAQEKLKSLKILGARYCSIQDNLAAQIKLMDDTGKQYTLYQTRVTDRLKVLNASEIFVDKVNVIQWVENGTFYGLASSNGQR